MALTSNEDSFLISQRGKSDTPVTLDDLKATLIEYFWQPLEAKLENIHTLHLVTQGDLHFLPYDLGCPAHLNLHTYPGLLFYYKVHHQHCPLKKV